jgi:DNA-binding PadR family transcriptional regulator
MPARTIGLYALATMERVGAVHGYMLSERIADRTAGAWRPGPGSVYPSLRALVDRGLARSRGAGRRKEYRITPAGRAALRTIRRRAQVAGTTGPDLSALWAEISGSGDTGRFLVRRLERTLEGLEAYAAARAGDREARRILREATALLRRARATLEPPPKRRAAGGRRSRV